MFIYPTTFFSNPSANSEVNLWTFANTETQIWLDAQDSSTLTYNTTTGAISNWADKTGKGFNQRQFSTSRRPIRTEAGFNGLPCIQFISVNEHFFSGILPNGGTLIRNVDRFTYFIVFNSGNGTTNSGIVNHTQSGSNAKLNIRNDISASLRHGIQGRRINTDSTSTVYTANNTNVREKNYINSYTVNYSTQTTTIRTNGTNVITTAFGTVGLTANDIGERYFIGGIWGGSPPVDSRFNGLLCELACVHDDNLTLIEKAEGYLAHKWLMTNDLDANHPYKVNPPTI